MTEEEPQNAPAEETEEASKAEGSEAAEAAEPATDTDSSAAPHEKEPLTRGTKIRIAVAAACIAVVAVTAAATFVSTNMAEYQKAVGSYDRSAAALQERNEALDQAIASLELLVNSGAQPLEPRLIDEANTLIQEAEGEKDAVPPMPSGIEDIRNTTNRIRISGNYAQIIARLNEAEDALRAASPCASWW